MWSKFLSFLQSRAFKVDDREEDLAAAGPPPELQWKERSPQSAPVKKEELQQKP